MPQVLFDPARRKNQESFRKIVLIQRTTTIARASTITLQCNMMAWPRPVRLTLLAHALKQAGA
jgi:hypothetical protein